MPPPKDQPPRKDLGVQIRVPIEVNLNSILVTPFAQKMSLPPPDIRMEESNGPYIVPTPTSVPSVRSRWEVEKHAREVASKMTAADSSVLGEPPVAM